MRLTKDTVLSIELLNKLTTRPQRVQDLAQQLGTTKPFLSQIVHKLARGQVVNVKRGPNGGICSVLTPQRPKITINEVLCALGRALSVDSGTKQGETTEKIVAALAGISVSEFAAPQLRVVGEATEQKSEESDSSVKAA